MPSEDSKPVKKEEDSKSSGSQNVPSANAKPHLKLPKVKKEDPEASDSPKPTKPASSASRSKQAKVKKEENDDIDDDDNNPIAKRSSNSKELKKVRKVKEEEKNKGENAAEQKKRERKVYDLPGQKRDPPEEKDPLRIFYESLYEQVPNSEMAQVWMMESGLLPEEVALKVYEKKQKKSPQQKLTSPVKAVVGEKCSIRSVTVKKKKLSSSPAPSVKKKTAESTSKQSKKRKAKDLSSESEDDSDDSVVLAKAKRRKAS